MIEGVIQETGTPILTLKIIGKGRTEATVQGILDTGFDGFLCLPIPLAISLGLELIDVTRTELADGTIVEDELVFLGRAEWDGVVVNNPPPKGGRLRAGKRRSVPDRKVCSMLDTQAVLPNTGFRCWNSTLTLCQRAGWTLPASARFCAFAPTGFYNESEVQVKGLSPNGLRPIPLSP